MESSSESFFKENSQKKEKIGKLMLITQLTFIIADTPFSGPESASELVIWFVGKILYIIEFV